MLADALQSRTSLSRIVEPLLVRAARREPTERTPVWFMRQAGRSLPEYRTIREQYTLFEVCDRPEICTEITLQPVRRHDVDAAVMFSDIMFPVLSMGIDVELVENVGPVVGEPIRGRADVARLRPGEPVKEILEAVALVRRELRPDQALVGFCGGPFTVAGYLVEGKPSREFTRVKALMYNDPETWHALLERLSDTFARYVAAKVEAGADVIQLFDSWVGALSPADYEEFVAPWSARILAAVDVPTIHFGTGTATLLRSMAAAGGDVIGLDWRVDLDAGWAAVGHDVAVQGNLDPVVLLSKPAYIRERVKDILGRAGGRPGHIFNLGHGILPQTPVENARALVEIVHELSDRR
jgi:uroporphyrinogen decarboxylase